MKLDPVFIPKPWGQEIWYTGIEARGESGVWIDGERMPLSAYLAADRDVEAGALPLLLKVLDPQPTEVTGDLYFEVHEEKQEVYVVTAIDPEAWPEGRGAIRFGMNQALREAYADDDAFRLAYLQSVQAYEAVRRRIDAGEVKLEHEETEKRRAMEHFTAMRDLGIGDVVRVPTWFPHSLQHGVRVVEFQTATYERFIVSFAQRVLTQDHWDTEHAVTRMSIEPPEPEAFESVDKGIERIARFDDFNVWRAHGATSRAIALDPNLPYAVIMAIDACTAGDLALAPEEACLVPHAALDIDIRSEGTLLIAAPGL